MNFAERIDHPDSGIGMLHVVKRADSLPGAAAMTQALHRKCPHPNMPEPKLVAYREELRDYGHRYVQTMLVLKPKHRIAIGAHLGAHDDINATMDKRAAARKKLIQRFWRHLGAA